MEEQQLPIGTEVRLTYPDGSEKVGVIEEYDNYTCIVRLEDGTVQCLGG